MAERPVRARTDPDGYQVIDVAVRGGYHPAAIVAKAGLPLRMVFQRDDDDACSERVVFSAPRLDRRLAPTGVTMVELPPQPLGVIRFTCGMGRYRGHIDIVGDRRTSMIARLRDQASRLETALGTAVVLWICSLPLIAVFALLALDATATIAAAGAVLTAWVAGCLWAIGRSPEQT